MITQDMKLQHAWENFAVDGSTAAEWLAAADQATKKQLISLLSSAAGLAVDHCKDKRTRLQKEQI